MSMATTKTGGAAKPATAGRKPSTARKGNKPHVKITPRGDRKFDVTLDASAFGKDTPFFAKPTDEDGIVRVIFGARVGALVATEIAIDEETAVKHIVRACLVHRDRMEADPPHKPDTGNRNMVDLVAWEIARGGTAEEGTAIRAKLKNTKTRPDRAVAIVTGVEPTAEEPEAAEPVAA